MTKKVGNTPALSRISHLSAKWLADITETHKTHRGDDTYTLTDGIRAFEALLRTGSSKEITFSRQAMSTGRASAKMVTALYTDRILHEHLDNPRLVPQPSGGMIAKAVFGDIAIAPRNTLRHEAVRNAAITIMNDRRLPNDGLPRLLYPSMKTYLSGSDPHSWKHLADGPVALGGGMKVFFEEATVTLKISSIEGAYLGEISLIDNFAKRISDLTNAKTFKDAWLAHVEEVLSLTEKAIVDLERLLSAERTMHPNSGKDDPFVINPKEIGRTLVKLLAFGSKATPKFLYLHAFEDTWEEAFVMGQLAAKINNAMSGPQSISEFDDMMHSDIVAIINFLTGLLDPLENLYRSYVLEKTVSNRLDINIENMPTEPFMRPKWRELRRVIDELVYRAGVPNKEGKRSISFDFFDGGFHVRDTSNRGALEHFEEDSPGRAHIESLVKALGNGAHVKYYDGKTPAGNKALVAMRITVDEGMDGGSVNSASGGGSIVKAGEALRAQDSSTDLAEAIFADSGVEAIAANSALATSAVAMIQGAALASTATHMIL